MRAAYADTFGGDHPLDNLQLGELPDPVPGPGEALIRVVAASLNRHDIWTLRGISSRPLVGRQVLGCDGVGVVEGYGPGGTGEAPGAAPAIGSRVVVHAVITCRSCPACLTGEEIHCARIAVLSDAGMPGTMAGLLCVPLGNLVALPDSVDDHTAACLPTAYLTAYRMLFTRAGLRPGQRVLVQGASGGVATAAILLARSAGIACYATARSDTKRRVALDLGAIAVFDSTDPAVAKQVLADTGGVDCVIDTVGEPTWDLSLRSLRPGGVLVVAGTTAGANPPAQLNRIFWRHLTVAGSSMGTRAELVRLVELCATGDLMPLIDRVIPFTEVGQGLRRLEAGEQRGKIVVNVAG